MKAKYVVEETVVAAVLVEADSPEAAADQVAREPYYEADERKYKTITYRVLPADFNASVNVTHVFDESDLANWRKRNATNS